jgi:hypothetical protein
MRSRCLRSAAAGAAMIVLGLALPARCDNNPNGMSFRAVGWFKGKAEISAGDIKCEIPSTTSAISDGAFAIGLWNTYGFATLMFPDTSNPFGNPCGVWIQLQNNMINQAVVLDHIELAFRIPGARRFRRSVNTARQFPVACREFRHDTLWVGTRINPVNSTEDTSSSGAPNVAFIEMLPFVSNETIQCLRAQYGPLPTTTFASLPLVIKATAVAISDSGDTFRSNSIAYTLNLRHTCGNGRTDDGEQCDPTAPANACFGTCTGGKCSQNASLACTTDAQCIGSCLGAGSTAECTCVY